MVCRRQVVHLPDRLINIQYVTTKLSPKLTYIYIYIYIYIHEDIARFLISHLFMDVVKFEFVNRNFTCEIKTKMTSILKRRNRFLWPFLTVTRRHTVTL